MSTATAIFTRNPHDFNNYVSNPPKSRENTAEEFSLEEISDHDNVTDCWIVVYDRIYDITRFINEVNWLRLLFILYTSSISSNLIFFDFLILASRWCGRPSRIRWKRRDDRLSKYGP